jgi:leader peptidase (prepilin peptidase)/N-methyltransferase
VEAATALAFVALGAQYWGHPQDDWPLLLGVSLVEAALLVAVLFIDLELRLIPTVLVALLVALALAGAKLWPGLGLGSALLGGAVGFVAFGALVVLAHFVFGEGALGMGDANLALAIGCITGYPLVIFALSAGIFLGGIGAVAMLVARRGGLRSTMPYGPYLVLAVLFVLAHGNTINPLVRF